MEQEHQHQHQPPAAGDDVVVQLSASAVAAVDERSSTATGNEDDDDDANAAGKSRRTFSQSYKMAHRKPQSLGIVYGDLGTSPLYVFSTVKLEDPSKDDFLGLLSLILWTLVSIAFVKYTFIVLHADDHGEGGTFALYSLLRQHVNFKGNMPVPVTQLESDVNLKYHSKKSKLPSKMLEFLERSTAAQVIITGIVLCATSMVMGDGALTPAISGTFSGICIFCTDLMNGIPPIVRHYVQHVVSVREVMVFVTVRILPVRSVLPEERFLVDKLDHVGVYRCILQYGYMDNHNIDDDNFVVLVVASLKKIAENDHEIALLDSAFTNETTFVLGRTILKMSAKHNCFKRFVVNELYRFLQKNFRSNMSSLKIAHGKALQVGMLYEI